MGGGRESARGAVVGGLVENSIGVTGAVEVADPGMVERLAGKMRRTIDKRPVR